MEGKRERNRSLEVGSAHDAQSRVRIARNFGEVELSLGLDASGDLAEGRSISRGPPKT